jgi:GDPmannose 4,6-dehydratase
VARTAFITGITGQDGRYLAELLLAKGYEVHGLTRREPAYATGLIGPTPGLPAAIRSRLFFHQGDLTDGAALTDLIREIQPDEVYNLAAQSNVRASFDLPELTAEVTGVSVGRLLQSLRTAGVDARFYQASSSEMFGATPPPRSEQTAFAPRSPYGVAKVQGFWTTVNHRQAYGMFAVNGILFNHESPRRGETFVTRKITRAVAHIAAGLQDELHLGNLDAVRDWGYAPEYVEAMWRMLQTDEPEDFVIATGTAHSVRDFVQYAFAHAGLDWERYVRFDDRYLRPNEVDAVVGDASKAAAVLDWRPTVFAPELAAIMVDADLRLLDIERSAGAGRLAQR